MSVFIHDVKTSSEDKVLAYFNKQSRVECTVLIVADSV